MACTHCNYCQGCNYCDTCQSCNSCNACMGCVSCQGCDACQGCDKCMVTCDTMQALCVINSQSAPDYTGSVSWPTSPANKETIAKVWTASAWNQIKAIVDQLYGTGGSCSNSGESWGGSGFPSVSKDQIITADIYNQAAAALNRIPGGSTVPTVTGGGTTGDIIRSYHAQAIVDHLNGATIDYLACDQCNTACDGGCNTCQGCDGCENCNTCQGCNGCQDIS